MPVRAPAEHTDEPAPRSARTPAGAPPQLSRDGLIRLQRTAGNGAVRALVQRVTATPKADIAGLRKLLADGDEHGAIAHMGRMEPDEAARALADAGLRSLAVKAFGDEEMAHAMYAMKGPSLEQKLNWMSVEGSSWELVKPLLTDPAVPPEQKRALYGQNYMRTFFTRSATTTRWRRPSSCSAAGSSRS